MVKYNLLQRAILAAVATFSQVLGAPAQAGENSTAITSALPPAFELNARSTLSKRAYFTELGANHLFQGAVVHKYANEDTRHATQGWSSGIRTTVVNDTPEPMWVLFETTKDDNIYKVRDPDAPGVEKIKIGHGESAQIGNMPVGHSGAIRAYARCNVDGVGCAGDEGTQTKWEWTAMTGNKEGLVWINLSVVDGYATGGEITFGEGSSCRPISCVIEQTRLEEICPWDDLLDRGSGHANCRSDCRTKDDAYHCCLREWQWEKCQPTNQHLARECPAAYAWAEDHAPAHYDECDPHGEVVLTLKK